jgi:hypothetical protein
MQTPILRARLRHMLMLAGLVGVCLLSTSPAPNDLVDVTAVRSELKLFDDGNGHYLALVPFGDLFDHFYWGDGKDFWLVPVFGGKMDGNEAFDRVFWDPRIRQRWQASFYLKDGVYTLLCSDRKTVFHPTEPARAEELLGKASFHKQRWKRRAYALSRDTAGTYYYVDRARTEEVTDFRLYSGPRGALKPLRMTNVVSDSAGDVFATKSGELKLVLGKNEASWVQGKKAKVLILLPLEDNAQLIYGDLGVYTGQPLGTPCDLL